MHRCVLNCMQSACVYVDRATHQELKQLAVELGTTASDPLALLWN